MATKRITELQLRDSVTADVNFPGDDGIQTYRMTAAQIKDFVLANGNILLPMLAENVFHGLTQVPLADDDFLVLADTSDANKTKKALASSFVRALYRSVSVYPATVTANDGTLRLSGSTGTITLPAASGVVAGKALKFVHAGTSFTNQYTIAAAGSDTIDGAASQIMYGKGEFILLESNGSDTWVILDRREYQGRAIVKNSRATNVASGDTITGAAYAALILNTLEGDNSFVALAGNQLTLQPGTYEIEGFMPVQYGATAGIWYKCRLRNITDSSDTASGLTASQSNTQGQGVSSTIPCPITGIFTITSPKIFELQGRTSGSTQNIGATANFGDNNTYTTLKINRLGN